MCRGKHSTYTGFNTFHGFSHPLGVLEHIPVHKEGLLYSLCHSKEIILKHKSPMLLLFVQFVNDSPSTTFKTEALTGWSGSSPRPPLQPCAHPLANNSSHTNTLCPFPTVLVNMSLLRPGMSFLLSPPR